MIQQVKYTSPFIGWMYVYIYFGGFILLLKPKAYIHLFIHDEVLFNAPLQKAISFRQRAPSSLLLYRLARPPGEQ